MIGGSPESAVVCRVFRSVEAEGVGKVHREIVTTENLRALLEGMLTPIRRSRDTPLQFEIDSRAIAEAALTEFLPGVPASGRGDELDWESLVATLNALVEGALHPGGTKPLADIPSPHPPPQRPSTRDIPVSDSPPIPSQATAHPLITWLNSLFAVLRDVDHRTFEILAMRLEGFQDRDIAEKLGTGLRLVKRITREARLNWIKETES